MRRTRGRGGSTKTSGLPKPDAEAPTRQEQTRFIADAMLGSLARKLRAFGFDTAYYKEGDDRGILAIANREGRIVLTADRGLSSRALKSGQVAFLLTGNTDAARLKEIVALAGEQSVRLSRGEPLCSDCNGSLVRITRRVARLEVPRSAAERHRLFFKCTSCGKHYWKGSHWKKLRRLERPFKAR